MNPITTLSAGFALVALAACSSPAVDKGPTPGPSPPPGFPEQAQVVQSEGGGWQVGWWLEEPALQPAALFDHGLFDLRVALRTADGRLPGPDVELVVDAGMPQHRHGMNVVPELETLSPGEYRASGLLFHMPGDWTVTFDVVSGALAERAQAVLGVE